MRWPRQELETARPLRTSPLYDALAARGAVFGSKNGWERANYFIADDAGADSSRRIAHRPTLGTPNWLEHVIAEQRATRNAVALYDQTSFGKLLLQGRDALRRPRAPVAPTPSTWPVGRLVYTPMLNERGGFESDLTITRLAPDRFLLVTGSAQPTRDADWIARHTRACEHAALSDVSGLTAVLSVMGPNAQALLARAGGRGRPRSSPRSSCASRTRPRSTSASRASVRRE